MAERKYLLSSLQVRWNGTLEAEDENIAVQRALHPEGLLAEKRHGTVQTVIRQRIVSGRLLVYTSGDCIIYPLLQRQKFRK